MLAGMPKGGIEGSILSRFLASDAADREDADKGEAGPLVITPEGDVIVAASPDKVLLVRADRDGDGYTDGVATLMRGLRDPRSLVLDGGWLYVAEAARIIRVRFHPGQGKVSGAQEIVAALPAGSSAFSVVQGRSSD
jgi:glucose/arabinose dehydrogenase